MSQDSFEHLSLNPSILRALAQEGYEHPTPIQVEAIPPILAGRDLLATAQTGTGKAAAFALPILHRLSADKPGGPAGVRVLVLTPTRELALQIDESFRTYGRHLSVRTAVVLGGVGVAPQVQALRRKPAVLIATPGRLLDLIGQGHAQLGQVEVLVLDEADRMLDMGFVRDVRKIVRACPRERQTLLFSATLSDDVRELAADMMDQPLRVVVTPPASVSGKITQKVLFVETRNKRALLTDVLGGREIDRVLVFTRTKHRANRLKTQLAEAGISADAIHGNKTQKARQDALAKFDRGRVRVLVATDIVARGIDVEGISHVINYEMPDDPENYVHRIGRTARAGAEGIALSFCGAEELPLLKDIERLTRSPLTLVDDHRYHDARIAAMRAGAVPMPKAPAAGRRSGSRAGENGTAAGGASRRYRAPATIRQGVETPTNGSRHLGAVKAGGKNGAGLPTFGRGRKSTR